ncbi:GNAT family N-acetyltransferase [Frankia sp. AgKG'84/4]|uniref:GNAT family N-acetyltransferase n=1 Tax=Frankia sp. AgKG'84/4 TaxID=573490 RepID=UPI00200DD4D3|nr:GNAT family N-acetyltransferase [Frankia sp. AgKG'84/4]MCL9793829.1 GNAT family N-acetyltransferase [Frankia sp. AgKG'84/4]
MLSREDFLRQVTRIAGGNHEKASFDAQLAADLGYDSFALLELHALLAEAGGVVLGEREWMSFGTVGELYQVYTNAWNQRGTAPHLGLGPTESMHVNRAITRDTVTSRNEVRSTPDSSLPDRVDSRVHGPGHVTPPPRSGQFFRLTTLTPPLIGFLYELAVSPEVGFRWRYRGAVPDFEKFERDLWAGVLAQFVVESVETGQPVGNVICYNPDLGLGTAYVGAAMLPSHLGSGLAIEPVKTFMNYVFDVWPMRKLYLEVPAFNFTQFASAQSENFRVEGRLIDHDYYQGRHWDRVIIAVYPERNRYLRTVRGDTRSSDS